jgi:hypothetical protein
MPETKSDQTDVTAQTKSTVEWLDECLSGWEVVGRNWPNSEGDVIIASAEDDVGTNGFAKASVINEVLSEAPSLEVRSTEDGEMAVSFEFKSN